jgi:hypothetical protein
LNRAASPHKKFERNEQPAMRKGMPVMSNATPHPDELHAAAASNNSASAADSALEQIRDALRGLRFGVVSIVVQDGVVVQIERTEKRRLR